VTRWQAARYVMAAVMLAALTWVAVHAWGAPWQRVAPLALAGGLLVAWAATRAARHPRDRR